MIDFCVRKIRKQLLIRLYFLMYVLGKAENVKKKFLPLIVVRNVFTMSKTLSRNLKMRTSLPDTVKCKVYKLLLLLLLQGTDLL